MFNSGWFIERFNPALFNLKNNPNPEFIESHRLSTYNPRGTDVDVVLDLMIHDIDILLQLVQSKISNIYASGKAVLTNSVDLANARIEFENGCVANLTASRISLKQMRQMRVLKKILTVWLTLVLLQLIDGKLTKEES